MRVPLLVACLAIAAFLAGCETTGPSSGENAGASPSDLGSSGFTNSYSLEANLTPPITTFTVVDHVFRMFGSSASYNASTSYNYTWTNSDRCGRFTPNGPSATWYHGEDTDCSHASPIHPGTITALVGGLGQQQSSTGYMACEYVNGSASGVGDKCFVSSVAPVGATPARRTSVPIPDASLPLLVLGVAAAALVATRGRGRA